MREGDPTPPFAPYVGDQPYVFVSYAHRDKTEVYPEILRLHQKGFRLWYDEGIEAGREWPEEIALRLDSASLVLLFVSGRFVESRNCRNEVHFALDRDKDLLAVHLEETALPPGLSLQVGSIQALERHRIPDEVFREKLETALEARAIRGETGESFQDEHSTTASPIVSKGRSRSSSLILFAALVVLVSIAAWWALDRRQSSTPQAVSGPESTETPQGKSSSLPSRPQLAIMSIEDRSGSTALSEAGISTILSDAFGQILQTSGEIHVVSPVRLDSVLRQLGRNFGDTAADPMLAKEVCERAEANLLLMGSLSRLGDSYLLSATLTELPSEHLLGRYSATAASESDLLEALTSEISEQLRSTLGEIFGGEIKSAERVGDVATTDLEAYASYIRGLDFSWEGRWQESIEELRSAVDLDPMMALAWSQLGCAFSFSGDGARSLAAQKKAEELSGRLGEKEGHFVRCKSLWIEGARGDRFVDCQKSFIDAYPDDRDGYLYAGFGERWLNGQCKEALPWYEGAFDLTPTYYPITKELAECHLELDQKQLAVETLERYLGIEARGHGRDQALQQLAVLGGSRAAEVSLERP